MPDVPTLLLALDRLEQRWRTRARDPHITPLEADIYLDCANALRDAIARHGL